MAATAEIWISYKAPHEPLPRFTAVHLEPEPEVERANGREVWVVNRPVATLDEAGAISIYAGVDPAKLERCVRMILKELASISQIARTLLQG